MVEVANLLIPFCESGSINWKSGGARRRVVASLAFVVLPWFGCTRLSISL